MLPKQMKQFGRKKKIFSKSLINLMNEDLHHKPRFTLSSLEAFSRECHLRLQPLKAQRTQRSVPQVMQTEILVRFS